MELLELVTKTKELFKNDRIEDLGEQLMHVVTTHDEAIMSDFCELVDNNLDVDWLQMIFQYYRADRKEKMQDYTPSSLARLVSKLTETNEEKTVLDLCAGSGALTIQKWCENKNLHFECVEYDKNVIPYLLFNLALRNIDAIVTRADVLSCEMFEKYKTIPSTRFSIVEKCDG